MASDLALAGSPELAVADRSVPAAASPAAEAGVGAEAATPVPKSPSAAPAPTPGAPAIPAAALGIIPLAPQPAAIEPVVETPQAPHRFIDRTAVWLQTGNLAAQTLDAITTHRFLALHTGAEANPFARLFVTHGWAGQVAYSYGWSVGGSLATAYWLHLHHHHRLERWVPALVAGSTMACGLQNLRLLHPAAR